jgi:hypothetical protein
MQDNQFFGGESSQFFSKTNHASYTKFHPHPLSGFRTGIFKQTVENSLYKAVFV